MISYDPRPAFRYTHIDPNEAFVKGASHCLAHPHKGSRNKKETVK